MQGMGLIVIRLCVVRRLWPWLCLLAAMGALTMAPGLDRWLQGVSGPLVHMIQRVVDRVVVTLGNGT